MATKKPMNKFVLYGIFVFKFVFSLALIIWTVYMTLQSDVGEDEDNAFLSTYHKVDAEFNNIKISNYKFNQRYDIKFYFNDTVIKGVSFDDVFLGQRSIKQRETKKNILKLGENIFKVEIVKKDGMVVKDIKIDMLVTMASTHKYDKKLDFKDANIDKFNIKKQGFWNITGIVKVEDLKGSFFIKTNN